MLMMQPDLDFLRCGMASRDTSNMAVRLTAITLSQSSGGYCSTGSVSPAMPALLISTSSPPSEATASRSEEHTSELQSHRDLHSFPTRRSSDLLVPVVRRVLLDRQREPRDAGIVDQHVEPAERSDRV